MNQDQRIQRTYNIVVAHLDDIEYGLFCFIKYKIKPEDKVNIFIASSGLYKHSSSFKYERVNIQLQNIKTLFLFLDNEPNIEIAPDPIDTLFYKNKKTIRNLLENWVKVATNQIEENILVTLAPDIHEDHRIISELCDVVVRPNLDNFDDSLFKEYYKFYIPDNYKYMKDYNIGAQYLLNSNQYKTIKEYNIMADNEIAKKYLLHKYSDQIINREKSVSNQEIIIKIF